MDNKITIRVRSKILESNFGPISFKSGEGTFIDVGDGVWLTFRFMEEGYLDMVACNYEQLKEFKKILGL